MRKSAGGGAVFSMASDMRDSIAGTLQRSVCAQMIAEHRQFPSMTFCSPDGLLTQAGNGFPVGSMLAKQGNGQPFFVGANETCTLTGSGPLKLAANCGSGPTDNPSLNADQWMEATTGPYSLNNGAVIARVILTRR